MDIKKVLSERKYKAGYIVRKEVVDDSEYGGDGELVLTRAYTPSGDYIGNSRWAYRLCKIRGIKPEKISPEHTVCSIGFCEKEQKWYGWSHRALYSFGIGSQIKRGDCAYVPVDKEDYESYMVDFWHDPETHAQTDAIATCKDGIDGVEISWVYNDKVKNKSLRGRISSVFQAYPSFYGKGEWTAVTLEDAKQMAMDFAEGVS